MSTEIEKKGSQELAHRHEKPSDWGWSQEFPKWGLVGGIASVIALILLISSTHYNESGTAWLILSAAFLAVGMWGSRHYRKRSYRK